jgi:hypothetical protein
MIPRYVFHHIPKCGGNSVIQALLPWFIPLQDYANKDAHVEGHEGPQSFRERRLDLEEIYWATDPPRILTGHFELAGCRLIERYPETGMAPYRRISFLRDPLERAVSHYHFAKQTGRFLVEQSSLQAYLEAQANPISWLFAEDPADAPAALRDYWFVGTIETAQRDLARLAAALGGAAPTMPHVNQTVRPEGQIPDAVIKNFRARNAIDYELYEIARS